MPTRYVHTNIIAKDWRALADFYCQVFCCVPVPPERDYKNAELDKLTNLKNAHQFGVHLRLPGHGDSGPTLEIFGFDETIPANSKAINRIGYGHLAFEVNDVAATRAEILKHGGTAIGEIVTLTNASGARVTLCYMTDPEGNAVEVQRWHSA